MGKRAEKPEKNEQPSNPPASEPSSGPGEESQAAAGGSTEHKLPVVWSPKLNAGTGIEAVPAFPVARVVDTTGAGDLFAAGFLSGLARGADDRTCGRLGALAAGEVIQHIGARPETSLKDLASDNGLAD